MVREEAYNSFQIIRPVEETPELRRFLVTADHIGKAIFGNSEAVYIDDATLEHEVDILVEQTIDTDTVVKRGVGVSKLDVYPRNGLKLPLIDSRSPKNYKTQALIRAYRNYLGPVDSPVNRRGQKARKTPMPYDSLRQAAIKLDIPDSSELTVTFNAITTVNDPSVNNRGIELALVPDSKKIPALLLHDEADILFDSFAENNRELALPAAKSIRFVSFARSPKITNSEDAAALGRYIGILERYIPIDLMLGSIEPKLNT